jgi:hypothetical protein
MLHYGFVLISSTRAMSALAPRLPTLLYSCAAASEQGEGDAARLGEQIRRDMQLLVAQYRHQAVAAALQ